MDEKSLSHTSWNCKYHIVLVPKYRRKVIYGKLRKDIGKILRMLCEYKHVEIIEGHAMPDHIHMLVSIPPKLAVADFMGYLKGKSTLMIFERHANLKYKYGRRVFWAKGYYVNTVGGNEAKIRKYIQEQEMQDQMSDQLSFREYEDPFKNIADLDGTSQHYRCRFSLSMCQNTNHNSIIYSSICSTFAVITISMPSYK